MTQPVKLYSLSTCSYCKSTKQFLDAHNVVYERVDVDLLPTLERASAIAEVKRINPRVSFPTILIGDTVIVGFREKEILEALQQ